MTGKYNHFGVPTTTKMDNESHFGEIKVYATSPDDHPYAVEFLRFEKDCPMPKEIQTMCHAAFEVEDLEEAMKGYKVIAEPFAVNENLKCAFVMDDQALIELMQIC
ncbi:MAG: hypothetical protein K9M75_05335 [Phycisphaerae bacterium]|nr:hypothetical protein [Phycisphaerae bacterium]